MIELGADIGKAVHKVAGLLEVIEGELLLNSTVFAGSPALPKLAKSLAGRDYTSLTHLLQVVCKHF